MQADDLTKWIFRAWFVWAGVCLAGGGTLFYFVVRALSKYIGE